MEIRASNLKKDKKRRIREVSQHEWWVWWGVIFAACSARRGGISLFEPSKVRRLVKRFFFGKGGCDVMSKERFRNIREFIYFAFYDKSCKEDDQYYPVRSLIDGFNDNRRKNIAAAVCIVLDESMSPFQPRTTKTSWLPNISFIFRKPKPLGVENKVSS